MPQQDYIDQWNKTAVRWAKAPKHSLYRLTLRERMRWLSQKMKQEQNP